MDAASKALGLTVTEAWLVVVTATAIYAVMVVLSRTFGQRHFAQASSYDLAFVFALGSLIGRVILVRTSLLAAVVGLTTMFCLHAAAGWLHHHSRTFHRLMQNRPVLLVARGEVLGEHLSSVQTSRAELYRLLRRHGRGSLDGVEAAILEPSGQLSVIPEGQPIDPDIFAEVVGAERLRR